MVPDFFFFKQKTAYEMRISDWSSDVCSSDLTLVRSSNRVRGQEKKVDRLRSDLLEAEEELRFVKAYENAAVHWHVVDQLIEIMSPAFAMGPAWTLMRSLSAHVSDEEADKATDIFVGAEKIESLARYRQIRARDRK